MGISGEQPSLLGSLSLLGWEWGCVLVNVGGNWDSLFGAPDCVTPSSIGPVCVGVSLPSTQQGVFMGILLVYSEKVVAESMFVMKIPLVGPSSRRTAEVAAG